MKLITQMHCNPNNSIKMKQAQDGIVLDRKDRYSRGGGSKVEREEERKPPTS